MVDRFSCQSVTTVFAVIVDCGVVFLVWCGSLVGLGVGARGKFLTWEIPMCFKGKRWLRVGVGKRNLKCGVEMEVGSFRLWKH